MTLSPYIVPRSFGGLYKGNLGMEEEKMNYTIYAWRSILVEKDIAERESTTITVDNVTVAEKIAVAVTEWMTDGEFGVTAVKCGEDIVTVIVQMDGEYLIDGDTYVNWRDVDDEIYYRIGEYASEKEMEQ